MKMVAIQTFCCERARLWVGDMLEEGAVGFCGKCDKPLYYVYRGKVYEIGKIIVKK